MKIGNLVIMNDESARYCRNKGKVAGGMIGIGVCVMRRWTRTICMAEFRANCLRSCAPQMHIQERVAIPLLPESFHR